MKLTQRSCSTSLRTLFWMFLKIGSTAWGGSMPLIAVVQNYLQKNNLLTEKEILDAIFLGTVLPGAMSFNVVVGVGYRLRGLMGALVCGVAILLPTFVLVVCLSVAYFQWGQVPVVDKLFKGFTPALVAIVISAAWSIGCQTIKNTPQIIISVAACAVLLANGGFYSTIGIVLSSGFVGWLLFKSSIPILPESSTSKPLVKLGSKPENSSKLFSVLPLPAMWLLTIKPTLVLKLFFTFACMSLTLFGGGYVFIPVIQKLVVNGHGWVTHKEFIDGIAIGQVTPGPILITSAFIGYKVAGLLGAFSATIGMFGPSAVLMVVSTYFLDTLKQSAVIQAALQGVRPAVVGMLIAAAFVVGTTTSPHWLSAVILVASLIAIIRFRVEVALIIPAAGIASLVFY